MIPHNSPGSLSAGPLSILDWTKFATNLIILPGNTRNKNCHCRMDDLQACGRKAQKSAKDGDGTEKDKTKSKLKSKFVIEWCHKVSSRIDTLSVKIGSDVINRSEGKTRDSWESKRNKARLEKLALLCDFRKFYLNLFDCRWLPLCSLLICTRAKIWFFFFAPYLVGFSSREYCVCRFFFCLYSFEALHRSLSMSLKCPFQGEFSFVDWISPKRLPIGWIGSVWVCVGGRSEQNKNPFQVTGATCWKPSNIRKIRTHSSKLWAKFRICFIPTETQIKWHCNVPSFFLFVSFRFFFDSHSLKSNLTNVLVDHHLELVWSWSP